MVTRLKRPKTGLPFLDIDSLVREENESRRLFPTQSVLDAGIDIDEGWWLEAPPSPAGAVPDYTFIAPTGERVRASEVLKEPPASTGFKIDTATRQYKPETQIIDYDAILRGKEPTVPIPERPTTMEVREEGRDVAAWNAEVERLGIEWQDFEKRQQAAMPEYERLGIEWGEYDIYQKQVEASIKAVYPETNLENFATWISESPEAFQEDIKAKGLTPQTVGLLQKVGLTEQDINQFFGVSIMRAVKPGEYLPPTTRQLSFKAFESMGLSKKEQYSMDIQDMSWWQRQVHLFLHPPPFDTKQAYRYSAPHRSFLAGIGDIMTSMGGVAKWAGMEDVSSQFNEFGRELQSLSTPFDKKEFTIGDIGDPEWWETKVVRTMPFALSLAPLAIGGFYGGSTVATALGIGKVGAMIIGSLTGAALSRPAESALEAGGTYNDAIARGKTDKEAREEANRVFTENLYLTGMDAAQIAVILAPTPPWVPRALVNSGLAKFVRVGGKTVITGLTEGGEEVYQETIQRWARGEEFKLDPITKEVFAIGAIMGVGMGLGGDVISQFMGDTQAKLSSAQQEQFDFDVERFKQTGSGDSLAQLQALENIMQTPEGMAVGFSVLADIQRGLEGVVPPTARAIGEAKAELGAEESLVKGVSNEQLAEIKTKPETELTQRDKDILKAQRINKGLAEAAAKEPWQMTKEEFITNPPEGYIYDPNLREGLIGHRYARGKKGEPITTIGDAFFKLTDTHERQMLIVHEEGHDLMRNFNRDWKDVLEPFRKNPERPLDVSSKYDNPFGLSDKPEEVVADAYTALWEGATKWYENPDYPANILLKRTIEVAKREGKPVPEEVLADYPDLQAKVKPAVPEVTMPEAKEPEKVSPFKKPPGRHEVPSFEEMTPEMFQQATKGGFIAPTAKGDVGEAVRAGLKRAAKTGKDVYAFPTAEGMKLGNEPPPFGVQHIILKPDGTHEVVPFKGGAKAKPPKPAEVAPEVKAEAVVTPPVKPPPPPPIKPSELGNTAPIPDDMIATKQVLGHIAFEAPKKGLANKITSGWRKFQVTMIDDLYEVKRYRDLAKKYSADINFQDDPYFSARLTRGVVGKANMFLDYGTFGRKFWKTEKGKAVLNYTGESLRNILKPVKDPTIWRDFSAYLTALRAVELANYEIESGIDIDIANQAITELESKYKNFPEIGNKIYDYQDRLLDYAQESGLISQELRDNLRAKYVTYVPFYRVIENAQGKGYLGKKLVDIASPVKRIKGSERDIINPLESVVKNTYAIISASERNMVGVMMANLSAKVPEIAPLFERIKTPVGRVASVSAKELGVDIEGLSEADQEKIVDIFRPSMYHPDNVVTVMAEGKKAYFQVEPELYKGLTAMNRETMGFLTKFFSMPAKWLRAGATLSPDFAIRNPLRDQLTAFVYSNFNYIPGVDFVRGVASLFKQDKYFQLYMSSGASYEVMVSVDREYMTRNFKEIVEGKKFTQYVKHPLELLQIMSSVGERATRLGEFKRGIDSGEIPPKVGYSSREVSLDFQKAGTVSRAVNQLVAFFNANVRGWDRLVQEAREHPVRMSMKVFVGITLPSIILYMVNRDDERWKEIPQWQKDIFWILFVGDKIYRIPKPFELGIMFGSVPERFLEYLDTKDTSILTATAKQLWESGSPGFMPTAVLPIIENITNFNFFRGRAVVPESRQDLPPAFQYTRYTTEVSKYLGKLLNYSPAKIDNIINGWTGGLGRYVITGLDRILEGTGISPKIIRPAPTLADTPVIKAFVVRNPYGSASEAVNRFYKVLDEYTEHERALKELLNTGKQDGFEKYKAKHPELLFFFDWDGGEHYSASARYLRTVARELSDIRKAETEIYDSKTMSPEEKRLKIDEIDMLITRTTRKALDLLMGTESNVLNVQLREIDNMLGEVEKEVPALSIDKTEYFTTADAFSAYARKLENVNKEDIPKSTSWIEAHYNKEVALNNYEILPFKQLYKINTDPGKGDTFENYSEQWKDRQRITDPAELTQHEKDYPYASLGNLTRQQYNLLIQYAESKKKKQFVKDNPDIGFDPSEEWLKANPEDNAILSLAGKAKIRTIEAYNHAQKLIKDLDIPNLALPKGLFPPEHTIGGYIEYQKILNERGANSWEMQMHLIENNDLRMFLDREFTDTPIESLKLNIKNRSFSDLYDAYADKDLDVYIEDNDEREIARKKLKEDNPEWVDDMRRIEAIEKGTMEEPTPDMVIDKHVEYGRMIDKEGVGANSAEVILFRYDNTDYNSFRMDENIWGEESLTEIDEKEIPKLRLVVKWRDKEAEYQGILDRFATDIPERNRQTDIFLTKPKNKPYAIARRMIEGYELGMDERVANSYVEYWDLPEYGKARARYLAQPEHNTLAVILNEKKGTKIENLADLPDVAHDKLIKKWHDDIKLYEDVGKPLSDDYIESDVDRVAKRREMMANARFRKARNELEAYELFIPNEYVGNWVEYKEKVYQKEAVSIPGYPKEVVNPYEEEWYLKANLTFYRKMRDMGLIPKQDFRNVPTREVWRAYQEYQDSPSYARKQMRADDRDLDEWLLITGKVTQSIQIWVTEQEEKFGSLEGMPEVPEWKKIAAGLKMGRIKR